MEARVIKLIECIESRKSQELSQIAAFQLGQLAKENVSLILEKIHKLFFHQNIEIRFSAALAFSEILNNVLVTCILPEIPLSFETMTNNQENTYKKQKIETDTFSIILNSFRDLILNGTWDEKHGSCLGFKIIMKLHKVCKECEEDIICRVILGISQDHTADYSGDLAEYPLRTLGAEAISLASPVIYSRLESIILTFVKVNTLGMLICFRKAKIYSNDVYNIVLNLLTIETNEDAITEACHYLVKYPLIQDQKLAEIILKLINNSDSLSSFINYAIKILGILFNLNCKLPENYSKIYTLFVHSLTEVRISTFSAFFGLVQKSCVDINLVFLLATQALLLETNQDILKKS